MDEAKILTTILSLGILFGLAIKWLVNNIIVNAQKISVMMKNNALYAKKEAEVAKMKADGEHHDWFSMPTPAGSVHVCKKTGYCPTLDGFIPMEMINSYLNALKREEEYKVFRNARVASLAKELGFNLSKMEEVVEKIFSMKKDFTVLQLERLSEDLKKRSSNVNSEQS